MIGSGNFGSALTRILGANAQRHTDLFEAEVKMYVHEEDIDGEKLTDIINREHENVKYLAGAKFTPNVVATPSLEDAVGDADMLAFCLPHQFLKGMLPTITANAKPGVIGLSAIKGIDFDDNGIVLCSELISKDLGMDTSILMGANVANQMANDEFCETTIGYSNAANGQKWFNAFNRPEFQVGLVEDTVGVELCGALKNIVAMGAGFCDGMDWGGNSKAAIKRIGLLEMKKFCNTFYDGIQDDTFLESCGVADLITTCYGGRNRLCAEAFARGGKTFDEIEAELLGGQSLQGTLTAKEVYHVLKMKGKLDDFPLFVTIYKISFEGMPVDQLASFAK